MKFELRVELILEAWHFELKGEALRRELSEDVRAEGRSPEARAE
jgi:hypothetical protein